VPEDEEQNLRDIANEWLHMEIQERMLRSGWEDLYFQVDLNRLANDTILYTQANGKIYHLSLLLLTSLCLVCWILEFIVASIASISHVLSPRDSHRHPIGWFCGSLQLLICSMACSKINNA
jgi:hypothetical protein